LKAAAAVFTDGLLFAFVNDFTIAGPADQVAAAFTAFESFLANPGLRINAAKSFIYALDFPNPSTLPQQLQQFTPSPEGIIVLGTPIGSPAFEKNFCMETAAETAERVAQILTMKSKHAQFMLCLNSANETITHLARTVPPCHFFEAAAAHNTAIFTALQALITIGELNKTSLDEVSPTNISWWSWVCQLSLRRSSFLLLTVKCSQPSRKCH
jgi:hypothetical protein